MHVIRIGLRAHQYYALAFAAPLRGAVGAEDRQAGRRAGGGVQPLRQQAPALHRGLLRLRVEPRQQELIDLAGLDARKRFFLRDHSLVDQVHRDLHRRGGRPLAAPALENEQSALLDRELQVLHVSIVLLEPLGDVQELRVDLRLVPLQLADRHRRAHAGDHVFALRVHQVLAVHPLLAGRDVAGEGNAHPGVLAHVSEDHRLHVDRGAQVVRDLVEVAVIEGALVIPGVEDSEDGEAELLLRVGGKVSAVFLANGRIEAQQNAGLASDRQLYCQGPRHPSRDVPRSALVRHIRVAAQRKRRFTIEPRRTPSAGAFSWIL